MDFCEFATRELLMRAVADRIAIGLSEAVSKRGKACIALSGGATPEPAYRALAGANLNWPRITFALVDERFVPPDHDASNEAMLRRALASPLAHGARLLPLFAPDLTKAAEDADQTYSHEQIDIAVMGMGDDGHTASWFPGMARLDEALDGASPHTVIAVHAGAAAGSSDRLTLTRSAIARAGAVILLITGDAKRQRLEQALANDDAPVASLFRPPVPQPEIWWAP
ncbi:MAG: 6-phosphogluconolactonase [Hyphomonadaceae bacterium]